MMFSTSLGVYLLRTTPVNNSVLWPLLKVTSWRWHPAAYNACCALLHGARPGAPNEVPARDPGSTKTRRPSPWKKPTWWWNPLSYVTDEVRAARLADHSFGAGYGTKSEAVAEGREAARRDGVEHVIKNEDGKISGKNSYGNDPRNVPG
ncbi:DUF2188 domain-containing protein [Paenarthrobacter sp. NEAU-H11]|uniref:DUF2188 domain-containing protein n=1 Tax=Paenarthrobacter sp. NEAU-H11 TaxID=3423924 RepID=UPI003D348259